MGDGVRRGRRREDIDRGEGKNEAPQAVEGSLEVLEGFEEEADGFGEKTHGFNEEGDCFGQEVCVGSEAVPGEASSCKEGTGLCSGREVRRECVESRSRGRYGC